METNDCPRFKPSIKAKTWNPEIEPVLFQKWQKEEIFKNDRESEEVTLSIDALSNENFQPEKIIILGFGYLRASNMPER